MGRGKPERGPISGPPGSGKSTYIKAIENVARSMGRQIVVIRSKECSDGEIVLKEVSQSELVKKISAVLHFTAGDGLRPSFDALAAAATGCDTISCLKEYASKRFRQDVAIWVESRLDILERVFIDNGIIKIPTCLAQYDEIVKRLLLGVVYVLRPKILKPVVIDDASSVITNDPYKEAYIAMMRPSKITANRFMDTKELLMFNPIVLAPGGAAGVYRLSRPDRYTILFDANRWEVSRREVEKIAFS